MQKKKKKISVQQLFGHMKSDNRILYKQPNTSTSLLFPEEQNFFIIWTLTSDIGIRICMVTFKLIKSTNY